MVSILHNLNYIGYRSRYLKQNFYKMFHAGSARANEIEECKKHVADYVIDNIILQDNMTIGIGSGSTIKYAVERLGQRIRNENFKNIICVPSSYQASSLIHEHGLVVGSLDHCTEIEWTIDGADEVDDKCNLIKGGGGCLAQEKVLAANSKKFLVIVDYTKVCKGLGTVWKSGIPVEVLPMAYKVIQFKIEKFAGGKVNLRNAVKKMGPVVTDNGNFILDWVFPAGITNLEKKAEMIKLMPGVVEVGLFVNLASVVYSAGPGNNIHEIYPVTQNENIHEIHSAAQSENTNNNNIC